MIVSTDRADRATVIVPVLNEAENIDELIDRLLPACRKAALNIEILFVDGGSTDGTQARVRERAREDPVRLIEENNRRGLAGAVVAGARAAATEALLVMDCDLSHPPELVPALLKPLLSGSHGMVIGSRYVPGGSIVGWSWHRKLLSRGATLISRLLIDVRDPMAGFFAVHRERLLSSAAESEGYKIGFEILAHGKAQPRTLEIPIEFIERQRGLSKANLKVGWAFLRRWALLAGGRFGSPLTPLAAMAADILVFLALFHAGQSRNVSQLKSMSIAWLLCHVLRARSEGRFDFLSLLKSSMIFLLAVFLRGGIFETLVRNRAWPPDLAIFAGAAAAAAVIEAGHSFFVFVGPDHCITGARRWRVAAAGLFAYVAALRLAYMGLANLNPQEAYYWNYSQHLDLSYLDHPPMTAWLIALGTKIFGNCEFGVRFGGFLCWLATVCFGFAFTKNLFGKDAAFRAIVILCITPFFLSFFMTPDAPLTACWAGTLFFLERALLGQRRAAFWGIGLCVGVGMVSKYTISLLGVGALVFLIFDRTSRRWVKIGDIAKVPMLALILFLPVILWNVKHDWVSFHFQSTRRLAAPSHFSLPFLGEGILLLLTPTVLLGVLLALFPGRERDAPERAEKTHDARWLFALIFTLTPLSVFILFSLFHLAKAEWTGPIWLACLPAVAQHMLPSASPTTDWRFRLNFGLWKPTVWAVALLAGGLLYYVSIGFPGVGYSVRHLPIGWDQLAKQIEDVEDAVELKTGREPLVVGVDQYYIASELAFYRSKFAANRDALEVAEAVDHSTSGQIFGQEGLMYGYWFRQSSIGDRPLILVGYKADELKRSAITRCFQNVEPVVPIDTFMNDHLTHHFFYRVCHGFQPPDRAQK